MFRRLITTLVAACGTLAIVGTSLLTVAPQASAVPTPCTKLCVYQFRSNQAKVLAPVSSTGGLAFGVPNSFGDGSRVELRNFSVTRTTEQWQPGALRGEIELGNTGLCLNGNAHQAYVRTCNGFPSQIWTVTTDPSGNVTFTNAKKLSLVVGSATAYANVLTSSGLAALWTPNPVS